MAPRNVQEKLRTRVRREGSKFSVSNSLPILFFGDVFHATIATVGLNPSSQEYLDPKGHELDGSGRRFESIISLGAENRSNLTDHQCERAIETMAAYFDPGKPVYQWFQHLNRVTSAMGFSYRDRQVAHLDLVQEATNPTWSSLKQAAAEEFKRLQDEDIPFLKWQLETFRFAIVVCNGKTVYDEVRRLISGTTKSTGTLKRLRWWAGLARIAGQPVGLAGWNIPLVQPTGLGNAGEAELGKTIRLSLRELGMAI